LEKLNFDLAETKVFLDGGLKTLEKYNQETVIKGDENIPVIALASIVAKVSRDAEMDVLAKTHDKYSWEKNKGYGTKAHMDAIDEFGTCELHRVSFLKNHV
jgi:ribonuclease HII